MNRHATKMVKCLECGAENQPAIQNCANCGILFGEYFCSICVFYDDDSSANVYHCQDCGICRVGKGLGTDQHHCKECGTCVSMAQAESHPCREGSLSGECPICLDFLATSTEQVVLLTCAHAIHSSCLASYLQHDYTCPVCLKSVADMSPWIAQIDEILANEVQSPGKEHKTSKILCNDCLNGSQVPSHHRFHKCPTCHSYNTRVLAHDQK